MDRFPHQQDEDDQGDLNDHDDPRVYDDILNFQEKKPKNLEKYNETDDNVLVEFKKKYHQSLEAIQSFQQILELKKNFTNIHHSYNPMRKKDPQSYSASKPKAKPVILPLPLKSKVEPILHLNLNKVQRVQQKGSATSRPVTPQKFEEAQPDSNRSKRNFLIRDPNARRPRGSSSIAQTSGKSPDIKNQKHLLIGIPGDPIKSALVPTLSTPMTKSPLSSRMHLRSQSSLYTPRQVREPQNDVEEMKKDNGGAQTERLERPLHQASMDSNNMDEIMGEPYMKIKIKNLANFQAEPLENYDQALTYKEENPASLLNEGIDRGYSKYINKKGETEWRECEILEYLEDEKKFLIRWRHDSSLKKVTRLNLRYAMESEDKFDQRLKTALVTRYKNLYMGSYKEMLHDKAKGDAWMNYPFESLNRIIKLAFERFEDMKESDTPLVLVDQLMDHYKQEIIRFSLEIRSFQSDFSAYVKKFTGAYRVLKNIPVVNQDKAIEILNMPYKQYREYKDWGDNVIVDKEEVEMAELKTFNDPKSQRVFHESLSKQSKLKFSQPTDALVKVYGAINLKNFLTLDETKIIPNMIPIFQLTDEDGKIRKVTDTDSYKSRAILKRNIRLVDVKKVKSEYKLLRPQKKQKSNVSYVITAFKQAFNKILPKSMENSSHFFTTVSYYLRQLSEMKLFQAITRFSYKNTIRSLEELDALRTEMTSDINKVELFIYRVQQSVDELRTDLKSLKNEAYEREILRRVCDFCTTMANDAAKICIRESLEDLINKLEEFYAFLPCPTISKEIYKMLSPEILEKRAKYREKLFLSQDDYGNLATEIDHKSTSENVVNPSSGTKSEKELMLAVMLYIMSDIIKGGDFFREGFVELQAIRLKPLFWIKCLTKAGAKNKSKIKIKMNRQDRARQRLNCRQNIYHFEEYKDRLLADQYRGEDVSDTFKTSIDINAKYIGNTSFNWFKMGKGVTVHEPHIYDIEERLKKIIVSAFEIFPKLERIDLTCNIFLSSNAQFDLALSNSSFVTLEGLEDDLLSFRTRLDELIKMSFIPVLAVFRLLSNFDFLITQEKHYISDIKDTFNDSPEKNIGIICEEIQELQADLDFVCIRLPKTFNFGFFLLDISEYSAKLKANIQTYINKLQEFLQQKLIEILSSNKAIVERIEQRLAKGSLMIDDYIELKMYLESSELKADLQTIEEGAELSEQINNYIEIFSIDYNTEVLETFYLSKGWIKELDITKRDAQVQLEASRPRLINELKQKNEEIFKELDTIKIDISNYANHYDINNALHYYTNAKFIVGRLDELMEYGEKCNFYEDMLFAKRTDFSGMGSVKENFEKFYSLWDFIYDKWTMKSDYWLNSPFEVLEIQDMEDLIQDGLRILTLLEDKFKQNINILELVRTYLREVYRFRDYLDILKKLKSETFKPRHWDMLWNEMYASMAIKPEVKTVTLKKLLEDKLFTYASLINTIYKNAQDEYNIEQEIEKIEESLTKIKDLKTDTYDVGNQNSIYILKGITQVLTKLNDHHFVIKNMLANPNYPRTFLDKLNNLESVIRGIKKILKLSDKVQKKFFTISPIMRHIFINQYFGKDHDHGATYNSIQSQFKNQIEGIVKKKMGYLVSLFDKTITADIPDLKHEVNGEEVIDNLQKILVKCDAIISDLYIVLKFARQSCPRLHILTDSQMIEYLSVVANPEEVIKGVSWVFTAVKELKMEVSKKHPLRITGVTTHSNETLTFPNKVALDPDEEDGSNFFICTLLNDMEKEIKKAVKENLITNMPDFFKNAYDYRKNFQLVQEKSLLFQLLVLLNNVLFYHDLSMIIASKEFISENARDTFTGNRLAMFKTNIDHNVAVLCENLPYVRDKPLFLLLNQFIFYIKHQVDILNYLMEAEVQSLDSFEYLILPKAMFEYNAKTIKESTFMHSSVISSKHFLEAIPSVQDFNQLNAKSEYLHHYMNLEPTNYNIVFKSLNYKKNYGFDLVPFTQPSVLPPSANKCYVSLLGAISTQTGGLVHGFQDRGKKEIIKGFAKMLGKEIFTIDQYSANYDFLTQLIFGAVKGSFWIVFDNIQEYSYEILSTMAHQIYLAKIALANGDTRIKYGSLLYDIKGDPNWGVFATYSSTRGNENQSLDRLPKNLLENFRILHLISPHLSYILTLYFEIFGVYNPLQAANRLVTFFQVISNAAENQLFFLSENLTMEDLELLQALSIRPSMALINKIMINLRQMILSQSVIKIDVPEIWKAIKESIANIAKERIIKLLLNLFNTIFQSDIVEKDPLSQDTEPSFKELFEKYKLERYSSVSTEFEIKCQQLYTIMNNPTSQYKTVLVTGRPGRGKTCILEAVATLLTVRRQKNFRLSWIDLDSTPAVLVLGGKQENNRLQGLIPILVDIAVNNMSQSDLQENEYANLISHCSRWANPKMSTPDATQTQFYDWIILEGTYDQLHLETIDIVERLLAGRRNGMITALDGLKIRVPRTMSFMIECDKMSALNPAHLSDVALVNLESNAFTLHQEFSKRISSLSKLSDFFAGIKPLLDVLFTEIIEPVIFNTHQENARKGLIYYLSPTYILQNFMSVFEIFLNECRKMEIAFGNITEAELERAEFHTEAKKNLIPQPQNDDKKGAKAMIISKGDIMGIKHSMKQEINPNSTQNSDRQNLMVESSCIFSLVWTIGIIYRPDSRRGFERILLEKIKSYYKESSLYDSNPPNPGFFMQFFKDKIGPSVFDYCLDIRTQSWISWNNLIFPEYQEISGDFSGIRLPTKEIAKFNPLLKKSAHTKKSFADSAFIRTHLPSTNDQIFVQTATSKKLLFFLDYLIAYKKPVVVVSEHENGKTSIINYKMRLLLEHNVYKTFSFSLTPFTTRNQLSKHIQSSLVKNFKAGYSVPLDMEGLIYIDDLHLSSIEHRPWALLKSFYNYKGWYNISKGTFIKLDRISFIAASSHSFLKTHNVFNESYSNLPQAFLHKMLLFYMPEMTSEDLKAIFKEYSEPILTEAEGKIYIKALKSYINQFLIFNFRNKDHLKALSHVFGCNLTIANALQMFKSLQLWDWTTEMTIQNLTDLWFFSIKRHYGNQFGKLRDFPEEFIIDAEELNLSRSISSSAVSPVSADKIVRRKSNLTFGDNGNNNLKRRSKKSLTAMAMIQEKEVQPTKEEIAQEKSAIHRDSKNLDEILEAHEGNNSQNDISDHKDKEDVEEEKDEGYKRIGTIEIPKSPSIAVNIETLKSEESDEGTLKEVTNDKGTLINLKVIQTSPDMLEGQKTEKEIDEHYNFTEAGRSSLQKNLPSRNPLIRIGAVKRTSIEESIEAVRKRMIHDEEIAFGKKRRPSIIQNLPGENNSNNTKPSDDTDQSQRIQTTESLPAQVGHDSNMEFLKPEASVSTGNTKNVRLEAKKQSQFSTYANRKPTNTSEMFGLRAERRKSGFSRTSIDQGFQSESETSSDKTVTSIASSDSDEETNMLEKRLNIEHNEDLANFPSDSLNIISKILIFSPVSSNKPKLNYKVSDGIVQEQVFAFNTELLSVERHELNTEGFTPIFQLVHTNDEVKKKDIMRYIQTQIGDHLPDNKSAVFFFNNFTFRLSSILPHLSSLLLELQTPQQHLFLTSTSQPLYSYHTLKFCAHILSYRVATFKLTPKRASNSDMHSQFINHLHDTISLSAHENRKCVFAILLDGFKPKGVEVSQQLFDSFIKILQDLNAIILGASLKSILPRHQLKTLITVLKKSDTYGHFPESHLLHILTQIVSTNVKFVIVAEEEALQVNSLTFRFEIHPEKLTLLELFLKYFPQSYVKFRKLILNDLQLSVDKKLILTEDVFPLDLDENLSTIFQSSYNYEVQFSILQDNEYGYSVLPNFRVAMLLVDFVYQELKSNLYAKAEASKGTGNSLVGPIKKLKKKIESVEGEVKDLKKFIEERQEEITHINDNSNNIRRRLEELTTEMKEVHRKLSTLEADLKGFNHEENILKKLQEAFNDVTNAIVIYNSQDYTEEIQFGKFFNSKFFTVYAILWCYIFNIKVEEEKVSSEVDISSVNIGVLTPKIVSAYAKEFVKTLNNYNQLKTKVLGFRFSTIKKENLSMMIDVIKDNNLTSGNVKFNKIQKNVMKWVDLVIETSKFELGRDSRIKEVRAIKSFTEQLVQDLSQRKELHDQLEAALTEQPKLILQVHERIRTAEKNINSLETAIKKMTKLYQCLEVIIKANFELNHPIASNKKLYIEYIRATSLYMVQCAKYSAKIRSHLFKLILNNMSSELNFNVHKVHHVLYGEAFLVDCLRENIPMSLNFVDNLAIFDMVLELNLQYPLIIDPSGLFLKYIKKTMGTSLVIEQLLPESSTIKNLTSALEHGSAIAVVDPNKDLLNLIEPILAWRYNQLVNKLYQKHYFSKQDNGHENEEENQDREEILVITEPQDMIEFNGSRYKVHQDFKLILIFQNSSAHLSKIFLEKTFIINNDINNEATWCETVSDILISTCYGSEREAAITKYYNEKLYNEANEQFKLLSDKVKKIDLLGPIDIPMLDQLNALAEAIQQKYKAQGFAGEQKWSKTSSQEESIALRKKSLQVQQKEEILSKIPLQESGSNPQMIAPSRKKLERSFSSLQKRNSQLKRVSERRNSVKSSFFHHSQSIAGTGNAGNEAAPMSLQKLTNSLYLEGMEVEEYSNLFNGFLDLNTILVKHHKLLGALYLIRSTIQIMNKDLGSAYSFSESQMLLNIYEALEVTMLNGYLKNTGKYEDLQKFETMVIYNTFHQLYSTFRKDHQNLFSFCYALLSLKFANEFSEVIWNFFLYRQVAFSAVQEIYSDPNLHAKWNDVGRYLTEFFNVCDNKIPPLLPFQIETSYFQKARKSIVNLSREGSLFRKYLLHERQTPRVLFPARGSKRAERISSLKLAITDKVKKNISLNIEKSAFSLSESAGQRKSGLSLSINTSFKSNDDNLFSPHFGSDMIQGIEIPKIANVVAKKDTNYTNINFHSNMADMLSKDPYQSFNQTVHANQAHINLGDSPLIPKQAYNLNFAESLEQMKEEDVSNRVQTDNNNKKSLFSKENTSSIYQFEQPATERKEESKHRASSQTNVSEKSRKDNSIIRLQPMTSRSEKIKSTEIIGSTENIEEKDKDDEVMFENNLLSSLKMLIPQVSGLFADIEKNLTKWTEFLNRSMYRFKLHDHILPQMPNNWNNSFNTLEILAIIKCLRPDALENFLKGALGEIKHRSYYVMPRTNFESHARSNWYKRPTLVLFGNEYSNPTENIDLLACRNKNQCFKISLGDTPLDFVFDELTRCCENGKWLVMENLHLMQLEHLPALIKKVNSELENPNTSSLFKLWITYYQEGPSYCTFHFPEFKRPFLEPFFKTCFKTYVNVSDSVKSRLFEFYRGNFLDFYAQLEQGLEDMEKMQEDFLTQQQNNKGQIITGPLKKIKQHRLKLQQSEDKIDLYEIFQRKLLKKGAEPETTLKMELQDQNLKVRFTTSFLFSIIRERSKYEQNLPANLLKNYSLYVSDNDLGDLLDDILDFTEKNMFAPFSFVEKFFSFLFNHKAPSFMTFNHVNIKYMFRTFVANNQSFSAIQVKEISYKMLKAAVSSETQIFQCIRNLPNEDPPQLFGYNVNNDILLSYEKSKSMFSFLLKCDASINKKETSDNECMELEKLILNQKHETELEVILEEYMAIKNDQAAFQMESAIRVVSLIKKLLSFLPYSFDLKSVSYLGVYQNQIPKHPLKKGEGHSMPGSVFSKPLLTVTSYDEETAKIPTRRRPSAESVKDKLINEAFKVSYAQKYKTPDNAKTKNRKFSFTMTDTVKCSARKRSTTAKMTKTLGPLLAMKSSITKLSPSQKPHLDLNRENSKGSQNFSRRTSTQKSEEKSAEEGAKITNKEIFKNLILNEIKLCNKTLNKVRNDLEYALRVIKGSEIVESVHPAHSVILALMKNELPESWYNLGSLPIAQSASLITFLRILSIKYENLRALVKDRECLMYPIISLPKLFDPLFLFVSMIWGYCQQSKIPFNECELILQRAHSRPATQQNEVGGIYVSGFKMSGGHIDERASVLQDEFSREFTSNLGSFMIRVKRRTKMTCLLPDEDPSIPLIIKQRIEKMNEKQNEKIGDPGELVPNYFEYMKKFNLNKVSKKGKDDEAVYYPVRIPLVDPCSRIFKNYFNLELYLYVYSVKPQEYWQMKGTSVLLQIEQ